MYSKIFGDGPGAITATNDPYKVNTSFATEMEIAQLLGIGLQEWGEKTWAERKAWVYFQILKSEKRSHQIEDAKQEHDRQALMKQRMPKVDIDRGRR